MNNYTYYAISFLLMTTLLGCSSEQTVSDKTESYNSDIWPTLSVTKDPVVEKRVSDILSQMSIEQKVGQLIQPEIKYISPQEAKEYYIGSILNGGGTRPNNDPDANIADWVALSEAFYQQSISQHASLPKIPIMWGSDAVHGHNNVKGAILFPHNIGLGATRDTDLLRRIGSVTAEDVLVTGINWTFSPTVAVVRDDRWGRTYEGYSEDPEIVGNFAAAVVEGIQSVGGQDTPQVISTVKHFIGDGGTTHGIDRGDTNISEEELYRIHAPGFISAIKAGSLSVMASFNSWNSEKIHGHKYLLTTILKGKLGFDGLVVGDWNAHRQVEGCTVESCPASINAGVDIMMVPQDWKALYKNTLAQAKSGVISETRLNDAVSRILRVKIKSGLFDSPNPKNRRLSADSSVIFSDSRRALAREAVRKSLVLLKNNNNALPIKGNAKVLVVGDGAHDIGFQSGGWTLSWQGTGTKRSDFPNGISIYEAIQASLKQYGGEAILSVDGEYEGSVDAVIVVSGEPPYAEWHGDIPNVEFERGKKKMLEQLRKASDRYVPVISIFLSGRPMWVNPEINASDAFVAAWLPGTEATGIADLIIADQNGKTNFDFTGKLSYSWPKSPDQIVNRFDENYEPLFEYGYGLNYRSDKHLPAVEERILDADNNQASSEWIFVSRVISPWQIKALLADSDDTVVENNYFISGGDDQLEIVSVDKDSQEDARRITWPEKANASVAFAADKLQVLNHLDLKSTVLEFDIKQDKASLESLTVSALCGQQCRKSYRLSELSPKVKIGQWHRVSIPLSCFAQASTESVGHALSFQGKDKGITELANIRFLSSKDKKQCHLNNNK